jgi:hypothetical protein
MARSFLIQILIPLQRGDGSPVTKSEFDALAAELTDKFGGVTSYLHAPADGWWEGNERREQDHVVIVEVMADDIQEAYWKKLRERARAWIGVRANSHASARDAGALNLLHRSRGYGRSPPSFRCRNRTFARIDMAAHAWLSSPPLLVPPLGLTLALSASRSTS